MTAKVLSKDTPVKYSNGDAKNGSELVKVTSKTLTPTSDTSQKIIKCVQYKTLCDALNELGDYERKNPQDFMLKTIDPLRLHGRGVINHHPIIGGGDGKTKGIEDTEFKDPRLPYFVDIEYVEVAYILHRRLPQHPKIAEDFYLGWVGFKYGISGTALSDLKTVLKTFDLEKRKGTGLFHRPNYLGIQIGALIAKNHTDIKSFAQEFCKNECS